MDRDRYYQSKAARVSAALDDIQAAGATLADAAADLLRIQAANPKDQAAEAKATAALRSATIDFQKMSAYYSDFWD